MCRRGNRIQVIWRVPQFGARWRANIIVPEVEGLSPRDTITVFSQPWGGLNVVVVYWWTPSTNRWTTEKINDKLPAGTPGLRAYGRLESIVSPSNASTPNQTSIFARNALGDVFRFFWSPDAPWALERL